MNYIKSNMATSDENKREVILAIVGPSASGKDTLAKELASRLDCKTLVSDTTRPRRKNEIDGVDYNFLAKAEFLDKIDNKEYLEWTNFKGWFYGTPKSQIKDNISIGVFNLEGLARLHRNTGYEVVPIYLNDGFFTRLKRSIKRENKIKIEYFRRGLVDGIDFAGAQNYLKSCYTKYIDMSENDWTIEQIADRVIFMLKRWAILNN